MLLLLKRKALKILAEIIIYFDTRHFWCTKVLSMQSISIASNQAELNAEQKNLIAMIWFETLSLR